MKKTLLFLSLLPVSVVVSAHPTAQQLTEQIKQKGAQAVITGLYTDEEKEWQYVSGEISKGKDGWLTVAALLAPGSDADSAETLSESVAMAIPHNPAGVLNIITERFTSLSLGEICGLPFYRMTELEFNQYFVDAIRALYKVPSSKACIDAMVNTLGASAAFMEDN